MSLAVLTAVTGAPWESGLVASLDRAGLGVSVVRRCVDLADLLAAAATGTARAVLLSADLRRLDRDAVVRLHAAGVAVVGLVAPGDELADRRLRQLGVATVLPADAGAEAVSVAVVEAVTRLGTESVTAEHDAALADPRAALPELPNGDRQEFGASPGSGRLIAVWGPTGAPGRTTVAVNVAGELANLGLPVLLADADSYGGAVAQVLGLLDEAPGLAAAVRLANSGQLDLPALARLARIVGPRLRVLTGIARADRWPELRATGLGTVWSIARGLAPYRVVDCGFAIERDEELSFDTTAPRRNGATLVTLAAADLVLAVGAADPVAVQRLVRALDELRDVAPGVPVRVVINKVRRGPIGSDPERQLAIALDRYAGVSGVTSLPYDTAACDAALAGGRLLSEAAPGSALRTAIAALSAELAGRAGDGQGRNRRRLLRRTR